MTTPKLAQHTVPIQPHLPLSFFPRGLRVIFKMSKPNSTAWSSWEKKNLLPWLLQRQGMTWKAKSKAYFKQFGLKRTGEALRSKQNYLLRKLRAIQKSPSQASFVDRRPWIQREDTSSTFPPPPPIFTPRARNAETCHLSHVRQILERSTGRFARGISKSAGQAHLVIHSECHTI
ncbi:hypothetical protein MYU51_019575 [Penicillium brevicompactum]